jgi:hypothetical protein
MRSNTILNLRRHDHPGRILDLEPRSEHQLHQPLGRVHVLCRSLSTTGIGSPARSDADRQLVLDRHDQHPSPTTVSDVLIHLSNQPGTSAAKRCARNDPERMRLLLAGRGERHVYLPGVDLRHPCVLVQLLELEPEHSVPVARYGDFRLHPREQHYRRSPTDAEQRCERLCAVWLCEVVHDRCQRQLWDCVHQVRDHERTVPGAQP